ncbi:MAG: hypothetical protein HY744_20790 [Deltaproteobacteria bacterium]|nr:hypothetical protein [Deltaproteobacteria bacterium]
MTRLPANQRMSLAGAALLLALAGACAGGGTTARGPEATLRAYAAALEQGRADDAYALLSDEAKRTVSLETFRRMVAENRQDVRDIARALSQPASAPLVTATVVAPGGDRLTLLFEDGRWRVDGTGIDRYGQATPRQALEGFLRALERKRYDVIMRYVPDAEREGRSWAAWGEPVAGSAAAGAADAGADAAADVADAGPRGAGQDVALTAEKLRHYWEGDEKEEMARIVEAIKSALPTARIEETEDRAAMPYGAGGTVLFVREGGRWKIEDLR